MSNSINLKETRWISENHTDNSRLILCFGENNLLYLISHDSKIDIWHFDLNGESISVENEAGLQQESYLFNMKDNILNLSGLSESKTLEGQYKVLENEEVPKKIELPSTEPLTTDEQGNPVTRYGWMGMLDEKFMINEICIPGTHDSGAWKCDDRILKNYILTQEDDFKWQLEWGIRFLDLRLSTNLDFFHGRFSLGHSFESFMNVCKEFLEKNPSEVIIASIKQEDGDSWEDFDRNLRSRFLENDDWKDMFYLGTSIPRIKFVRKKIILLRRFRSANPNLGINATDWQDNKAFEFSDSMGKPIHVQDRYDTDGNYNEKMRYIITDFELTHKQLKKMYINFFSHVPSFGSGIRYVASVINGRFKNSQSYENLKTRYYNGCYPMDFFDYDTLKLMILSNLKRTW